MSNLESGHRGKSWTIYLFLLLFSATLLNYAARFVFTQNTSNIQFEFKENQQFSSLEELREAADADPDVSIDAHLDKSAYADAASNFSLGFAFGALIFGTLADVISVRLLYPLVVVVWSIAGIATGMVDTVTGLWISRLFVGLFEAGHWPCALRTTQRTFHPAQRTGANSILQSGASIGAVLTPLLVLFYLHNYPTEWRHAFLIVGVCGVPWAICWLLVVRESDITQPVIQTDETSAGVGTNQELVEIPFWNIFTTRRWWVLLFTVICINTVWHFIRVWMVDWLENVHGYESDFVAQFTSAYFLSTFAGALASGAVISWLVKKDWNVHKARMTAFVVFACLTALIVPAAFMPKGGLLLFVLLIVAFGSLGLFPIYYSLNQEISAKHQGKVGGSLGFATWFLLYFFHGWVGELLEVNPDSRQTIFCAVGLLPFVAFFVLKYCWGQRPQSPVTLSES